MKTSRRPRTTAKLSETTQERLNSYARAAVAAGVGILALTHAADAKISYTQTNQKFGPDGSIAFDLNHDGINDFELDAFTSASGDSYGFARLSVRHSPNNAVWGEVISHRSFALDLHDNVRIGPKGQFFNNAGVLIALVFDGNNSTNGSFLGPWVGQPGHRTVKDRYLGLRFLIKGKTHFGWARLKVTSAGFPKGIITTLSGYAYETVPNKSIGAGVTQDAANSEPNPASFTAPTPKPAPLGLLALGSPGLSIWRREESASGTV